MSRTALSLQEVIDMMKHVAGGMQDSRDILTEADRMGDADHGEGMARGFAAVADMLAEKDPGATVGEVMNATGRALMMKTGGAAGAVFGTLFRGGGAGLLEKTEFDA
ncbi:MAG: DAK2 domain-containing protein, partial [Spirochaetia bacterium]